MNGRDKCNVLRGIRKEIAERYRLKYEPTECTYEGDCLGTCPRCEAELRDLQQQLKNKGIEDIYLDDSIPLPDNEIEPENEIRNQDDITLEGDSETHKEPIQEEVEKEVPTRMHMIGMPSSEILYKKKRLFFKECAIAGWKFHDPTEWWDELEEDQELILVRDKKNKHDRNAVAVALPCEYEADTDILHFGCIIGYVPRTENEMIAKMIDMGWKGVFSTELSTLKKHGAPDARLRMTIYIQSRDELEEMEDSLYAVKLNEERLEYVKNQLLEKGFVHFRWGGFAPWELQLPLKNDQVIFLYQDEKKTQLYRMKLIAVGEDAAYFLENPREELDMVDDCAPYILTNMHGPISVENYQLSFMDDEEISTYQPDGKLSWELKKQFEELFEEYN